MATPALRVRVVLTLRVFNDVDSKTSGPDSEKPRDCYCLKSILHRTYGKFMAFLRFICLAILHVFFRVAYECDAHNVVGELLEILGSSIISAQSKSRRHP